MSDSNWVVWGSAKDPLFEGSEEQAKQFVEDSEENSDLYVQSPQGDEYMYERGTWVEATSK